MYTRHLLGEELLLLAPGEHVLLAELGPALLRLEPCQCALHTSGDGHEQVRVEPPEVVRIEARDQRVLPTKHGVRVEYPVAGGVGLDRGADLLERGGAQQD